MAFTMACPNFKKGLKMAFGPLGVIGVCYGWNLVNLGNLFYMKTMQWCNAKLFCYCMPY
jgi:hypothetical protein